MKKRILPIFIIVVLLLVSIHAFAKDTTMIAPKSYGVDNLNNEKGDLVIAFLGGSITQGVGAEGTIEYKDDAGSGNSRWSTQITKRYFQKKYPNKNVIEVNAAIGGTRSDCGLFRMKQQLLDKCGSEGPDVVFIEFAVNDVAICEANPLLVQQRMEGIIRQLAHLPKQPVVIFVLTAAKDSEQEDFSRYLNSAKVHKSVADYYKIGSINLCEYVAGGVDIYGKPIVWSAKKSGTWSGDLVHPNNTGYTGYADFIKKQFDEHPERYFKKLTWNKIPMSDYEFGAPALYSPKSEQVVLGEGWSVDTSSKFASNFPDGAFVSSTPGSVLSFDFKGRSLGIYSSASKSGGRATYTITEKGTNHVVATGTVNSSGTSEKWSVNRVINPLTMLEPKEYTAKVVVDRPSGNTPETVVVTYFMADEELPDPIVYDVATDQQTGKPGTEIKGSYRYVNAEKEEGDTVFQWMVSDSENGSYEPIDDTNQMEFTPDSSFAGKYVKFAVLPKDKSGTTGKSVSSAPVRISRPLPSEAFQVSNIQFLKDGKPIGDLLSGAITSKVRVTNQLKVSQKAVMLVAEYVENPTGMKTLISFKKETVEIGGGETKELTAELTVTGGENHKVQAMILAEDNFEPLTKVSTLPGGSVVSMGKDESEIPTFAFQINRFVE